MAKGKKRMASGSKHIQKKILGSATKNFIRTSFRSLLGTIQVKG